MLACDQALDRTGPPGNRRVDPHHLPFGGVAVKSLGHDPPVLRGLLHAAGAGSQEAATAAERARAKAWEAEIAKRRYAVIIDEAHSGQTGETARELKAILGAGAAGGGTARGRPPLKIPTAGRTGRTA